MFNYLVELSSEKCSGSLCGGKSKPGNFRPRLTLLAEPKNPSQGLQTIANFPEISALFYNDAILES